MNTSLDKFHELGYVVVTDFISPEELERLILEVDRYTEIGLSRVDDGENWTMNEPHNPCKLEGAMQVSEVFRDLGRNDKLTETARKLLGLEHLDTYISKFFPMIPERGFSVDFHQDNHYIRSNPDKLISCDVFVKGATKERGCLRVMPMSHHGTNDALHAKPSNGPFNWMWITRYDLLVDIEMDDIFAIFFHPNLVHGCYKNKSDEFRPSIAWEYIERDYVPMTHKGHQSQDRFKV